MEIAKILTIFAREFTEKKYFNRMIHLLQATNLAIDTLNVGPKVEKLTKDLAEGNIDWDQIINQLVHWALDAGKHILLAIVIYLIGHYLIKLLNYLLARFLERRQVEISVQTFVKSFVGILLQVLLIITVVSALGINTTSFAALLASFGVAIGMALSGNLQNLAGGIILLFLKPYKVGDWIEAQGMAGTVQAIHIFHTILMSIDGKLIYIPNGSMSSGTITNFTGTPTRRAEWVIGIEYGEDVEKARQVILGIIQNDARIKTDPAPEIWLNQLNSSSVDLTIRCWVDNGDLWDVLFQTREKIYNEFNKQGIGFPFPQVTVHQAEKSKK